MNAIISKGTPQDLDELEQLYDALHDHLESHINYPGWVKGVYPTREDAASGIAGNTLFVLRLDGAIAGTVVLNHQPEEAYATVDWQVELDYNDLLVIHTFATHPDYQNRGVGRQLLEFAVAHAAQQQMKAVRLDVYEKNFPAIRLYECCGFVHMGNVDLGYSERGLPSFRLYQRLL